VEIDPENQRGVRAKLFDALLNVHRDELVEGDLNPEPKPDWLDQAWCARSFEAFGGNNSAADVDIARDVLEAAGIPCYLALYEEDPPRGIPIPLREYRLMVPSAQSLEAASLLDEDLFNSEMEAEYQTHFQEMADEDLRTLDVETLTAGLLDRVERIRKAYREEMDRRGLARGI
jgi:hypothetical protein